MIVAFCGQADYSEEDNYHDRIIGLLEEIVGDQPCDFYLGGIDHFDHLMRRYCAEYQKTHQHSVLFLVAPIVGQTNLPGPFVTERYDAILYPSIEPLFPLDAISRRDRWMVERADIVIMNIRDEHMSENEIYQFAVKKSKTVYHLSSNEPT